MTIRELRQIWIKERPRYEKLCGEVEKLIKVQLRQTGILPIEVVSRPKDPDSLLKKIVKNEKSYDQITDKAAARVVVQFRHELRPVCEAIEKIFPIFKKEDKSEDLEYNEAGYQAIHYDVMISGDHPVDADLLGLACEIQVRTLCQDLWAVMNHSLSYKAVLDLPADLKRQIYLLSGVIEVADRTFLDVQDSIGSLVPRPVLNAITALERHFYRLAGKHFDLALTHESVVNLLELYDAAERTDINKVIDNFVNANAAKLGYVFEKYSATELRPFFLFQPEVLMVFERLAKDPFTLKDLWNAKFPPEELEDLSVLWGTPLP